MATYLGGVDINTSGAKAMVFDQAGKPLASACREYPYPRPGWVEQEADHTILKKPRIHLTNSPGYWRMRHRSLLFRTRLLFVAQPGGANDSTMARYPIMATNMKIILIL